MNLTYENLGSAGVKVTGQKNKATRIIIPERIEGKPVVSLEKGAFKDQGIKSVKLPSSLLKIEDNVFENNEIKELVIPEGIRVIGRSAFENNKIEKLRLPSTLTNIERSAFRNNKLPFLILPKKLKSIREFAFRGNQVKEVIFLSRIEDIGMLAFDKGGFDGPLGRFTVQEGNDTEILKQYKRYNFTGLNVLTKEQIENYSKMNQVLYL